MKFLICLLQRYIKINTLQYFAGCLLTDSFKKTYSSLLLSLLNENETCCICPKLSMI